MQKCRFQLRLRRAMLLMAILPLIIAIVFGDECTWYADEINAVVFHSRDVKVYRARLDTVREMLAPYDGFVSDISEEVQIPQRNRFAHGEVVVRTGSCRDWCEIEKVIELLNHPPSNVRRVRVFIGMPTSEVRDFRDNLENHPTVRVYSMLEWAWVEMSTGTVGLAPAELDAVFAYYVGRGSVYGKPEQNGDRILEKKWGQPRMALPLLRQWFTSMKGR